MFIPATESQCYRPIFNYGFEVEPTTGIEPVNLFLTKEALYLLSYVGSMCTLGAPVNFGSPLSLLHSLGRGAGDETRTRDIQLGRLKLYQLSYARSVVHSSLDLEFPGIKHTRGYTPFQ